MDFKRWLIYFTSYDTTITSAAAAAAFTFGQILYGSFFSLPRIIASIYHRLTGSARCIVKYCSVERVIVSPPPPPLPPPCLRPQLRHNQRSQLCVQFISFGYVSKLSERMAKWVSVLTFEWMQFVCACEEGPHDARIALISLRQQPSLNMNS